MIGDRDSDIQAGQNFGCKTIFVERGWKGEAGLAADYKVLSLAGAVEIIAKTTKI
jgi:phosphoglycolate phosphatase-like HAD superfamily hydrolase